MRSLAVAAIAAVALAVPMAAFGTGAPADAAHAPVVDGAVAETGALTPVPDLPEEAAMVLVGTLLLGFAAAVRRAA